MPSVLVDSNVLLDVISEDAEWFEWSADALATAAQDAELVINPIIFAEVTVRYARIEDANHALTAEVFRREALPWDAAFLAGKCFELYRKRGGARRSPLPDFFIGAHAAVRGHALLTRDPGRYRSYFPRLRLIAP